MRVTRLTLVNVPAIEAAELYSWLASWWFLLRLERMAP